MHNLKELFFLTYKNDMPYDTVIRKSKNYVVCQILTHIYFKFSSFEHTNNKQYTQSGTAY